MALPANVELMFGGAPEAAKLSKAEVSERFDDLVKSIQSVPERELTREEIVTSFRAGNPIDFAPRPNTPYEYMTKALRSPEMTKSMSPDAVASVAEALEALKGQQPDLTKDISTTSPIGTGLVAFDLEAPSFA